MGVETFLTFKHKKVIKNHKFVICNSFLFLQLLETSIAWNKFYLFTCVCENRWTMFKLGRALWMGDLQKTQSDSNLSV